MPPSELLALVYAKLPVPGRVKTRLARTLGPLEATRIYRLLAGDVETAIVRAQQAGQLEGALLLPPEDAAADDGRWLPGLTRRWSQGEGDLGARLQRGFEAGFDAGFSRVLAVGTDIVGVTPQFLARVDAALRTHDAVLAETPDGGYGILAVRDTVRPRLAEIFFDDMPWSTDAVAGITRHRAQAAGIRLQVLPGLRDVDVEADLDGVLPRLAILVPVLDEAPRLARHLPTVIAQARAHPGDVEVIVADGGSTDGSVALARELGAQVIETARGRGVQLRAAANAARARWLWTLHADAGVRHDAVATVLAWCRAGRHDWAACPSRFDSRAPLFRLIESLTDGRARVFRTPYGDQGLLVKRAAYEAVGGYPALPLMEDVELAWRLRHLPGPGRVPTQLTVDIRRWRRHGIVGTTLKNLWTLFRWRVLGTDAETLAATYSRGEVSTPAADTLGA